MDLCAEQRINNGISDRLYLLLGITWVRAHKANYTTHAHTRFLIPTLSEIRGGQLTSCRLKIRKCGTVFNLSPPPGPPPLCYQSHVSRGEKGEHVLIQTAFHQHGVQGRLGFKGTGKKKETRHCYLISIKGRFRETGNGSNFRSWWWSAEMFIWGILRVNLLNHWSMKIKPDKELVRM